MPVPTSAMAAEARRGLSWREEFNRGGTAVGVARARDIANRADLSDDTIGRMVSYFARHEVDKQGEGFSPGEDGYPSAGRIAWALWGGDPGQSWANAQWRRIQRERENRMAETGDSRRGTVMNTTKNISLRQCQVKFMQDEMTFSGYASVFGGLDSYNDTIERGAYEEVLQKMYHDEEEKPKMFINHRAWDIPIGKWTTLMEDEHGLRVEGEFTPGNQQAMQVRAAMQHGTIDGLSIGFQLGDYEMRKGEDGEMIRVIKSIKSLPEISVVTYPADDAARVDISSVKSRLDNLHSLKDLEDFLREVGGFSKSLATATASRARHIVAQSESDAPLILPEDLTRQIYANLLLSKTL